MRGSCGLYPGIGRYFSTLRELADAGCMSPRRAQDCLRGIKQFTNQEKVAIYNNIRLKQLLGVMYEPSLFDETFRIKE